MTYREARPLRILITGSRTWEDRQAMFRTLRGYAIPDRPVTLVHGDAKGADRMAGEIAQQFGWTVEKHPADWDKYGRSAGPKRNEKMLALGADVVLAFRADGVSRGTDHMIRIARDADLEVRVTRPLPVEVDT